MVGHDVHGATRTRGRQRRRQRGRGPPGTSAPTRDARKHKVPHDADHVIMVGRDVQGATRTRGRHRRRHRGRGPPGTLAPTRDTREHKVPRRPCYYGRARRPRRDAHMGTPAGTRAAGDVGPYQGYTGTQGAPPTMLLGIHGNTRCSMMMLCVIIGICSFSLESNRVPQNRICPRPHPIGSSAFAHHFILNAKLHGILALPPSSRL